jgi:hypothetical protein
LASKLSRPSALASSLPDPVPLRARIILKMKTSQLSGKLQNSDYSLIFK